METVTAEIFAFVGVATISVCATAVVTVPAVALVLAPRSARRVLLGLPFFSAVDSVVDFGGGPDEEATALATRCEPGNVVGDRCGGPTRALHRRGPYRLDRLLAQSSTVQVWEAVDTRDGTPVAFKCPLPHADRDGGVARTAERLTREGAALAEAAGKHVVGLHEAGDLAGAPFVAMRLATGGTLLETLARSPGGIDLDTVVDVIAQVADALGDAHRAGWVHRDVKASNVVYDPTLGRWLLGDFGIAQPHGEPALDRLTAPGWVVGTPSHLAPELLAGDDGDGGAGPASDVYALAVLTCQLLTGALPYPGPRGPGTPTLPPISRQRSEYAALDEVLARALALDPDTRYPTPAAFAHTLARVAAVHTSRLAAVPDPRRPQQPATGETHRWWVSSPSVRRPRDTTADPHAA